MNSYEEFHAETRRTQRTQRGIFVIFFIFISVFLFAQEEQESIYLTPPPERGEFWFSASAEIALYSERSFSYGAGFTLAYGKKASFGLKGAYFFDESKELDVLELYILFRLYLLKGAANRGPFFQLEGGPAIFFHREHDIELPAAFGMFSAGLTFGWRFLIGKTFFIEPSIRGGYPFIVGGALSMGVRF